MKKTPKNAEKYICEQCNFKCFKQSDYNRHVMTAKHKHRTNVDVLEQDLHQKTPKPFVCVCGKAYNARNSLWYHKKKCNFTPPALENSIVDPSVAGGDMNKFANDMKEIVMLLATSQNNNIKMLIENQEKVTIRL